MRGSDEHSEGLFSSVSCAAQVPANHPLRAIRAIVDEGLNNRAENSHQPTRCRERQMKRYKSTRQVQRFLAIHDPIANLFHLRRDHRTAAEYRAARAQAFQAGADVAGARLAA